MEGILGVLGGVGMSQLISKFMDTPTAISAPAILVAVVFSITGFFYAKSK